MDYNTSREKITLAEYGRHVKRIVDNCVKIEDRAHRNQTALEIIELMGQLNPHLRNVEDFRHKLWDHLFMISEFKLDVDSPYPKTTKSQIIEKPEPLEYFEQLLPDKHTLDFYTSVPWLLDFVQEHKIWNFPQLKLNSYLAQKELLLLHNKQLHTELLDTKD